MQQHLATTHAFARRHIRAIIFSLLLVGVVAALVAQASSTAHESDSQAAAQKTATDTSLASLGDSQLTATKTLADGTAVQSSGDAITPALLSQIQAQQQAQPDTSAERQQSNSVATQLRAVVPQSGTVLTLNGLDFNIFNYLPYTFGGEFNKAPYTMQKLNYPASFSLNSISKGVAALDKAVRTTQGQKIVLAHSQGAQVASAWMRKYANDPTAPSPSELTFLLIGNPLRSTGGHIIGNMQVDGTIGQATPTSTRWQIVDFARRYDGWSDWVQDKNNKWAVRNANEGKKSFHIRYDQARLYAPTNTVWKSGNTTYVLSKEDTLPMWPNTSGYPAGVVAAMRAEIERGYKRPANDPKVQKLPVESSWKGVLKSWKVPY